MSLKQNDDYLEAMREANEEAAAEILRDFCQLLILKAEQEAWWIQEDQDEEFIESETER